MSLLDKRQKRASGKVCILSRSPKLTRLLTAVLIEWKFSTIEDPSEADLLFVERGMALPAHDGRVVWLSPMPLVDEQFIVIPIELTHLYHFLETDIFPSPRRHVRVNMDLPADIKVDDVWREARLISLSDRGGRLVCAKEYPKGSKFLLEVKLAGRMLHLSCEVLYSVSAGEASGREMPQLGVYFAPLEPKVCAALRLFIERECLLRACDLAGISINDPAVSWIQTTPDPWRDFV